MNILFLRLTCCQKKRSLSSIVLNESIDKTSIAGPTYLINQVEQPLALPGSADKF